MGVRERMCVCHCNSEGCVGDLGCDWRAAVAVNVAIVKAMRVFFIRHTFYILLNEIFMTNL